MNNRQPWVKCPIEWVRRYGLHNFNSQSYADDIAALMCLVVISHHADQQTGVSHVTYDQFQLSMEKSRSLIARGINRLIDMKLISRTGTRSEYQLEQFDPSASWAKLPYKTLYNGVSIPFFIDMKMRSRVELDAMKLLFLFLAFRDNDSNMASISYDKIAEYTKIGRDRIKRGISLLAINGIAYSEVFPNQHQYGISMAYRVAGIEPYKHGGTIGRQLAHNMIN